MANNLSPELLAWLNQQQAVNPALGMGQIDPQTGNVLAPQRGQQTKDGTTYIPTSGSQGDGWRTVLSGDPYGKNSSSYYDNAGKYIADAQSADPSLTAGWQTALKYFAPVAGVGLAGAALAGAGGGGLGSGSGAFVGEGAASGIPAWDAAAGSGVAGAGGAAGGAATGSGVFNAAADSQLANAAIGPSAIDGYTAAGLGGVSASPIAASSGGSWLSNLLSPSASTAAGAGSVLSGVGSALGGGSSLLGLGATALGALAGSQPQKTEATTNKDLPAWLQPYVTNMAGKADNLLNQQMSPEAQAKWLQMQTAGQSLLAQPVAGNGYGTIKYGR